MKDFFYSGRWYRVGQALIIAMMLVTSGCASIPDAIKTAAPINPDRINVEEPIKLLRADWPGAQWWQRYGDMQLNHLIETALQKSPYMEVAEARIKAGRAQSALVTASSKAFLGAVGSLDRENVSSNGFLGPFAEDIPAEGLTGPWYTEGMLGIVAHYNFDVWGKDKARIAAAVGLENAREAEAASARLVLSTAVAQTYYEIQVNYALRALLNEERDILSLAIDSHAARYARGMEAKTYTEIADFQRLQLDQEIESVDNKQKILREAMRALLGAGPTELADIKPVPLPESAAQMPAELGYELLARRPDLQVLHWSVMASQSQIDVARAAFYPDFDINAFFGLDSIHLADLFHRSSRQINLLPGFSLPIFDSGRLNAQLSGARAQNDLAIAQYNQAVLDAIREVAQTGAQVQSIGTQLQLEEKKLNAVMFTADSMQAHYQRGLADMVTARESMIPILAENRKILALHSYQINREIALTMALGGGYKAVGQ